MPIVVQTGGPISPGDSVSTSAIPDYASLLLDAGEYSGRNDIANIFPRLVGLAESKINRDLRTADQMTLTTIDLVDGEGFLPDGYLEIISFVDPRRYGLNAISGRQLYNMFQSYGGVSYGYRIEGNRIILSPASDGEASLLYYSKIEGLTEDNTSNWLLEKAPDVYLYAVLEQVAILEQNPEKASAAAGLRMEAIRGLQINDERARWANSRFVVRGPTP